MTECFHFRDERYFISGVFLNGGKKNYQRLFSDLIMNNADKYLRDNARKTHISAVNLFKVIFIQMI